MTPKLIVTGFMGTGKSTIGSIVAKRLGWRFVDSDDEIVARAGAPIAQIFTERGEAFFRDLERKAIATLAADRRRCAQCGGPRPAVISTGGGVLVDSANAAALGRIGIIVCLGARPEIIAARLVRSGAKRPKLLEGGQPLLERINELLVERAEAYARADLQIDTSDLTIEQAAGRVIAAFGAKAARRCIPSASN
ncbi:MAG: shikimate kinase [Candidatus Binataceae bacterium]